MNTFKITYTGVTIKKNTSYNPNAKTLHKDITNKEYIDEYRSIFYSEFPHEELSSTDIELYLFLFRRKLKRDSLDSFI